jgi:hypothetical protein
VTPTSYKKQKQVIHSLVADGAVVSDHATMAKATFDHFNMLLGTDEGREFSLNLELLGSRSENLASLDGPINEEVWEVVCQLPRG